METVFPTRLEKLKAQQAKLAAQIQLAQAREKTLARKRDTRRKILVGACFLEEAKQNHSMEQLKIKMSEYLTRESDKALFESIH